MTNPRVRVTGKSTHRTATRPHQPPARNAPVKVRGSDLLIRRLTITDPAVARAAAEDDDRPRTCVVDRGPKPESITPCDPSDGNVARHQSPSSGRRRR